MYSKLAAVCYDCLRPIVGHRFALAVGDALPAVGIAALGLLLFAMIVR
jgi:hypothetical protein